MRAHRGLGMSHYPSIAAPLSDIEGGPHCERVSAVVYFSSGAGKFEEHSVYTSHVEQMNGTQRVFLKRVNRLTLCFFA